MSPIEILVAIAALGFFLYLIIPSSKPRRKTIPKSSRRARKENSEQGGQMTGLMGGEVEDAMISRHGLDRSLGDHGKADDRDVATSVAMQQAQPDD